MISAAVLLPLIFILACQAKVALASNILKPTSSGPGYANYDMVVSIAYAPLGTGDCYPMNAVLVNGMSGPTLEFVSGSKVSVSRAS